MKHLLLFILGIICWTIEGISQETHFSQFYSTSMYLNPALAGIDDETKFTLNYRNQWPEIKNSFITKNASLESKLTKYNNGIGISAYRDQAGDGLLTINSFSGSYAHEFKLNRELFLRLGVKGGLVQKNVAWDKLVFEDMIDSRDGVVFTSKQKIGEAINYVDLSSGVLLYSSKYYGGFSVNHLNQAEAGLINQNELSKLQRRYTLHGGAKFTMMGNSNYNFSPNIILTKQGTFSKVNIGAYVEASALVLGLWYSNAESIICIIGIKGNRFQVGYSYDLYSSKMIGSNIGSHEISYVQTFKKSKSKRKRYNTSSCPKF